MSCNWELDFPPLTTRLPPILRSGERVTDGPCFLVCIKLKIELSGSCFSAYVFFGLVVTSGNFLNENIFHCK